VKAAPRPAAGRTPPLVFTAFGELVVEKAGVLNPGIESMMPMGAAFAFRAALSGYSISASVLAGVLAGATASLVFGVLALTFLANYCVVGWRCQTSARAATTSRSVRTAWRTPALPCRAA
jgi:ABC-type uncharacterized transport system permease subunit